METESHNLIEQLQLYYMSLVDELLLVMDGNIYFILAFSGAAFGLLCGFFIFESYLTARKTRGKIVGAYKEEGSGKNKYYLVIEYTLKDGARHQERAVDYIDELKTLAKYRTNQVVKLNVSPSYDHDDISIAEQDIQHLYTCLVVYLIGLGVMVLQGSFESAVLATKIIMLSVIALRVGLWVLNTAAKIIFPTPSETDSQRVLADKRYDIHAVKPIEEFLKVNQEPFNR